MLISRAETSVERHINHKEARRLRERGKVCPLLEFEVIAVYFWPSGAYIYPLPTGSRTRLFSSSVGVQEPVPSWQNKQLEADVWRGDEVVSLVANSDFFFNFFHLTVWSTFGSIEGDL